jgi:hypothetical protein
MDKKNGLLDYLSQVFMNFGITVAILNVFCMIFGEEAQTMSTLFQLGGDGLAVATMMQFLLIILLINGLRVVLMTDLLIKKMPLALRIVAMFASVFGITTAGVVAFGWFPVTDALAWVMFVGCFIISCAISTGISIIAEKQENKKFEDALKRFKEEA